MFSTVEAYTLERISKDYIKVNVECTNGNAYHETVSGDYDLRNKCDREYAVFDAVKKLNDFGFYINFNFSPL